MTKGDGTVVDYDYDAAGNRESKATTEPGLPPPPPPPPPPPSNNPPSAVDDSVFVMGLYESGFKNLVANDSDPDGDSLTVTSVTQPWNAYVTIVAGTYVDVLGTRVGTGTFTYTVSDGNGGADTATVTVTVRRGRGDLF